MNALLTHPVNYDTLADAYQRSLVNVLRGLTAGEDFLELWVPDEDPVKGILNMIEAAQTAGRAALAIEVSSRTLGSDQLPRLQTLAAQLGDVAIAPLADSYVITAAGLQSAHRLTRDSVDANAITAGRPALADQPIAQERSTRETAEHYDILPALAAGVGADAGVSHEGTLDARSSHVVVEARSSAGQLSALVEPQTQIILQARHRDMASGAARAVANLVCREIEGRTMQDASDHGGILAIHHLYATAGRPKVSGILLPSNAGRAFAGVVDLLHRLRADYAAQTGLSSSNNVFDLPASTRWQSLSAAARLAEADVALGKFCKAQNLPADSVRVDHIENDLPGNPSRVVVTIDESVAAADKPIVLRALERHLKSSIDDKIQVYLEPLKDRNKLRRL